LSPKKIISPLRYPGSKRRLTSYIRNVLNENGLSPQVYIEPFLGGGSVALQLMQENKVDKIILMDVDPWISSFWKTVFFDTKWLIQHIEKTDITLELWKELKQSKPKTVRDMAWACFYLNRTSFSGILEKKAGPLGGKEQASKYKIDCRFPKETLIKRVLEIAHYRKKIHAIWNCSWQKGVQMLREEQEEGKLPSDGLFFYFDPPFFEKAENLYRFYFREKDHIALRDYLLTLQDNWMLSYDTAVQVEELYGDAIRHPANRTNRHHIDIYYSLSKMSQRKTVQEVIISNIQTLLPA
jgi:DNA adenine methylase